MLRSCVFQTSTAVCLFSSAKKIIKQTIVCINDEENACKSTFCLSIWKESDVYCVEKYLDYTSIIRTISLWNLYFHLSCRKPLHIFSHRVNKMFNTLTKYKSKSGSQKLFPKRSACNSKGTK